MNPSILLAIMPAASARATVYAPLLVHAMAEFGIDTPRRQAGFLAQVAHESESLRYTLELASGDAYEMRLDLGNVMTGDGRKFKGRGLIQITGRDNYRKCAGDLGVNLQQYPELLEKPVLACRSAGWFWRSRSLNQYADTDQFGTLTKKINGGFNGLDNRISFWLRARETLGVKPL